MNVSEWSERVAAASIAGDEACLRSLFQEAVDEFGHQEASHLFFTALSGLDHSAHTG